VLALAMLVFLLSLGGIPFVAGFWAKLYIFLAAAERGMYGLVFLGAVLTVVALYYYLLVARRMYIEAPLSREPVPVPALLGAAIAICAAGVVGIGVYPRPWVEATERIAATLVR
jgi:NADH-quinone oxidoreductase subunit N